MSLELISPEGTRIDLFPDTVISLEIKNTAMNADILEGSFSYSFALPLSETNRIFFGFPENIASKSGLLGTYSNFRLKSGLVEFICTLVVRSVSNGRINANLRTASGTLAEDMKRTSIRDVDMGEEVIPDWKSYMAFEFIYIDELFYLAKIVWSTEETENHLVLYYAGEITNDDPATTVADLVSRINTANPLPEIDPGDTVFLEFQIGFYDGIVYGANLSDSWENEPTGVTDDYWTYLCTTVDFFIWRASQAEAQNFSEWKWWDVDSNNDDKRMLAEVAEDVESVIVIYDPLNSAGKYLNPELSFNSETDGGKWNRYDEPLPSLPGYITSLVANNSISVARFMNFHSFYQGVRKRFTFFPIHNPSFSPDENFAAIVNYFKLTFFTNIYDLDTTYAMSAQPRLVHALESVASWFGKTIEDLGVLSNSFIDSLFVYSNYSNDRLVRREVVDDPNRSRYDSFTRLIRVAKSMPHITIADFLNGFRSYLFIGIWFDVFTNKIIFRPLKDVITDFANAIDLTDHVAPLTEISIDQPDGFALRYGHDGGDGFISEFLGSDPYFDGRTILDPVAAIGDLPESEINGAICLVTDEDEWFENVLQLDNEYEWVFYCKNMVDAKIGNGEQQYAPKCSTLLMYEGHDFGTGPKYDPPVFIQGEEFDYKAGDFVQNDDGDFYYCLADNTDEPLSNTDFWEPRNKRVWRVPMAKQGRFSDNFNEKNTSTLRLLSYVGRLPNPFDEDELLPLATNDLYRDAGVLWPEERGGSLKWDGQYGIYEQWGKEWLDFLQRTKKATTTLPLTESLLSRIKPWKLIKIGGNFYLIGSLKVNLPLTNSEGTLSLYLVR